MTYDQLASRVAAVIHRQDLASLMPSWAQDATDRINRRFGLQLAAPDNSMTSNAVLSGWGDLYLFACLVSAYEHLSNPGQAQYYEQRFMAEADRQNITAASSATDPYTTEPPVIVAESRA